MRTSPDFEFEYIDTPISIELDNDVRAKDTEKKSVSPTVRIDSLTAAHDNSVRVAPNDSVVRATTVMWVESFSQLPVMTTDREVKVSWRSIGMAYAEGRSPSEVRECMEDAHEIDIKTTLADASDEIWKHGYVLVRGEDKRITDIVTVADLADQFRQLAQPFLLIGEIEHHLRDFVRGRFTFDEFAVAATGEMEIKGLDDLTFGNYCRLLEEQGSWEKLGLNIDRKEFTKRLEKVRNIRNDVMHFSPDGIETGDLEQFKRLARLLRQLAHS